MQNSQKTLVFYIDAVDKLRSQYYYNIKQFCYEIYCVIVRGLISVVEQETMCISSVDRRVSCADIVQS